VILRRETLQQVREKEQPRVIVFQVENLMEEVQHHSKEKTEQQERVLIKILDLLVVKVAIQIVRNVNRLGHVMIALVKHTISQHETAVQVKEEMIVQ
jgi:hypothetical protein